MNWMRLNVPRMVLRERVDRQRLGQAGHALDQHVALRQDRHQHALEKVILADHHALDLVEHPLHQLAGFLALDRLAVIADAVAIRSSGSATDFHSIAQK